MKDIASLSTTQYILDKYDLFPKKKYGQNFLIDKTVIERVIKEAQLNKDCAVIEIGPGIGALTQIISRYAGYLRSYEIDERFKEVYKEFFDDEVEFVFQDFLKCDLSELKELKDKYDRVIVIANLPYYITSKIIEKIVVETDFIDEIIVMVQKEVALKFTGDYKNPLLLTIEDRGDIEYLFTVSKNVFIPKPHVDSAILKIVLKKACDKKLYQLIELAYIQRRKTIYNNLKKDYANITDILNKCHIDPQSRCDQLTLSDYKNIIQQIKEGNDYEN